jgi:hypothetical protein
MHIISQLVSLLLFLFACLGATFPLFFNHEAPINFSKSIISICFGTMAAGLIYALSIRVGLSSAYPTMIALLALTIFNSWRFKDHISFNIFSLTHFDFVLYLSIFLVFGGLFIATAYQMGKGSFPIMFFNTDTPYRLSQAFSLISASEYPPESLMTEGMRYAYHYGGPTTVALISRVTQIAVHKVMFWIMIPLLALGLYCIILEITRHLTPNRYYQLFCTLLFVPNFLLGEHALTLFAPNSILDGQELLRLVTTNLIETIPDIAPISSFFLLALSVLLVISNPSSRIVVLALFSVFLTIFFKTNLAPAVFILGMISLWRASNVVFSRPAWVFSSGILVGGSFLFLSVFGYFQPEFQYRDPQNISGDLGMSKIHSVMEILTNHEWSIFSLPLFPTEGYFALGLFFVGLLFVAVCKPCQRNERVFLVATIPIVVMTFGTWVVSLIVPISGIGSHVFIEGNWILTPLIVTALTGLATKKNVRRLIGLSLGPLFLVPFVAQGHKFSYSLLAIYSPQDIDEYADNRLIGDALRYIPLNSQSWIWSKYQKNAQSRGALPDGDQLNSLNHLKSAIDSKHPEALPSSFIAPFFFEKYVYRYPDLETAYLATGMVEPISKWGERHFEKFGKINGRVLSLSPLIVTNDFRYLQWSSTQPQISGIFGHRAYGTQLDFFPGPRGFNREGERRIGAQRKYLSRDFTISNPGFAANTKKIARERGWTHFLLRKDLDDELPSIDSNVIPLHKLYENERYAVFEF